MRTATSTSWLRRLVHEALGPTSPRGVDALLDIVAAACGASSAVLWDSTENGSGGVRPTMLATSLDGRAPLVPASASGPDATTLAAFVSRTLILPDLPDLPDLSDRADGPTGSRAGPASAVPILPPVPILAALPVDYVDGSAGALTLLGPGELTAEAFDVAADLLDVLPVLLSSTRDRQTLSLVNRCNDILGDAEAEAARESLPPERLVAHLELICEAIARGLDCGEVSVRLHDEMASQESVPVVATWKAPLGLEGNHRNGRLGGPIDGLGRLGRLARLDPGVTAEPHLLVVPVTTGARVWGAISCTRTPGSPARFTRSDIAMLTPVATQVAQYWGSWLQRRTISAEIASWRHLASAVTGFNKLLADELKRKEPDDHHVYEQALQIVQEVVPDCTGADIRRPVRSAARPVTLTVAHATGLHRVASSAGTAHGEATPVAAAVYASKRQQSTTDPGAIAAECLDPAARWLVSTPVSVGDKTFGVLDAFGPARELPVNSPQVCEIVSDQLGLYEHLQGTLQRLQQTRSRLEATMRGQAEALEDLEHQLVSPLLAATSRTERVLQSGRFDLRTASQLRAIRGLCRKASRVALSAGVFAALSEGRAPSPKLELHGADDVLRTLIAAADDAQLLSNPRRRITFEVDRDSVRSLGRRLVSLDRTFLEQCVGNILDNAAKYSFEDTSVDLSGALVDGAFAIDVTNTGLSLQPQEAALCLQRNWRGVLARSSSGEGSGLGLWIADNLMRSMHASITIIPAADRTTVRLRLPLVDIARNADLARKAGS